jgi:bacterioferritin-associated ferredoxin
MTQESEAPIKLPSATVVKALFAEANRVKEQLSSISGTFGDRVKAQVEVGNLCGPAFRQAASIFKKARNNELKAKEHLYHLRAYLDWVEEDLVKKGHVANLDDMAKEAAEGEAPSEGQGESDLNKQPTGEGGVPLGDAQKQLEGAKAIAENRRAARKALELPEDGSAAAPPAPPATTEKPKRGRKPKAAAETSEPQASASDPVEAAPPPPPAPTLADDEEEDLRPEFLKRRERERAGEQASVH